MSRLDRTPAKPNHLPGCICCTFASCEEHMQQFSVEVGCAGCRAERARVSHTELLDEALEKIRKCGPIQMSWGWVVSLEYLLDEVVPLIERARTPEEER